MKYLVILILFTNYAFAENVDCSTYKNSCEYYLCLETQKKCGENGYLKSFGHRYCQRYEKEITNQFSTEAKDWLINVRTCLIDELDSVSQALSCGQLKRYAINSHVKCYIKTKFCNIPRKDKITLLKSVADVPKEYQLLSSGIRILRSCRVIRFY